MKRLVLTAGRRGSAVGQQIGDGEGIGTIPMGIQRQQQRRSFLHDPDARVPMAVDAAFVALGLAEPTLQLEIVPGEIRVVIADEEAIPEARHHGGEVLPNRVAVGLEAIPKRLELGAARGATSVGRVECRIDRGNVRHLLPDGLLPLRHQIEAATDAAGQPTQQRLGPPPLRASRFRRSDCPTSPSASAIRSPGGCSGPP